MNRVATFALTPLSVVYGLGVRIRNGLYRRGILRSDDVGAPVISIGNLTTGGTGKTPFVELLAGQMAANGRRVCVLTRGYGRNSSGRLIVSDNDRVLASVNEAGDEPFMLAESLRGRAAVICDKNRVAAAHWAIENLGSEIFILDDAFQHQKIRRAVNILIIDATNPFGNRKLFPAGILREPIKEAKRADCIVITRANESGEHDQLRAYLKRIAGAAPIFISNVELTVVRSLDEHSVEDLTDRKLAAFCGIGNPQSFFALLRREGFDVTYRREFHDHYRYSQTDIDRIIRDASAHGAHALVTTTKDAVKLSQMRFAIPCFVVDTSMQIENAEEFLRFINQSIQH